VLLDGKLYMTKRQGNYSAHSSGKVKKPLLSWLGQINHLKKLQRVSATFWELNRSQTNRVF